MNAEWIDALDREKWPPRLKRVLGFGRFSKTPVICYQDHGEWFSNDHNNQYSITHWMHLPEPPKRESSFEKWWNKCANLPIGIDGLPKDPLKVWCNSAWYAAVAASKQPDFME